MPNWSFYNSQEIGLAKALIRLGVSVDIFTYSKKRGSKINTIILKTKDGNDIRLLEYGGLRLPGQQAFSWALLRYLLKKGKDYSVFQVYEISQIMTFLASYTAKKLGVPCLLYQGMYRDFDNRWKKRLQKIYNILFMRPLFSNLSLVIGKTESALEYLRSKGMPPRLTKKVIHVGLDTNVFSEVDFLKQDGGMALEQYDVLYIGKIEKRRMPNFLAELLLELCRLKNDFKACVVGDGPERQVFIDKIRGLTASGKVTYIPKVENKNLPNIYRKSKLLLNPTNYEIFGMSMLEAMYFGVPVIASPEAGPKEIIANGIDGLLLEGFDLSTWKKGVMELLENKLLRRDMGKRASCKIQEKFVWEYSAPIFKELYHSLINK